MISRGRVSNGQDHGDRNMKSGDLVQGQPDCYMIGQTESLFGPISFQICEWEMMSPALCAFDEYEIKA